MKDILDLDRYPIDRPDSEDYRRLVAACQQALTQHGMFNLDGFVRPEAIARAAAQVQPLARSESFTHQRDHNVYFQDQVPGLDPGHGALKRFQTAHHTLCDDQLTATLVHAIYEYAPLPVFLAEVMRVPRLFLMEDPLARANVMEYREGEALNWHFDRSIYTTTLLIQAPEQGGEFEYRSNLRSDTDPNYDGVARLLAGSDRDIRVNPLSAGTLNVFAGKNTLHRVSPVRGTRSRLVAVLSYYDKPGVRFSDAERTGFYGRTG
jgi:hypothetical protein